MTAMSAKAKNDMENYQNTFTASKLDFNEFEILTPRLRAPKCRPWRGAHFVAEFSLARASLIRYLVERHDFNAIGLECGAIQASRLSEYLNSTAGAHELERFSDPLTFSLYGSVLIWIKSYLRESGRKLQLVGIDLPNTLNQGTTGTIGRNYQGHRSPH